MAIEGLSKAQNEAAETLNKPLFIQAGAGTGKTYTLTKRLAYALSPASGVACGQPGQPYLPDTSNFMTITFTEKATDELLSRIRSTLRQAGLEEQALAVDSAWVSTIHGMCRRLLLDNILQSGIDPDADVPPDILSDYWLNQLFNQLLDSHAEDAEITRLLNEYGDSWLRNMAVQVAERLAELPNGVADVELCQPEHSPSELLRMLLTETNRLIRDIEGLEKPGKKDIGNIALLQSVSAEAQIALDSPGDRLYLDAYQLVNELNIAASNNCFDEIVDSIGAIQLEAIAGKQHDDLQVLLGFAAELGDIYSEFRRQHAMMTHDELMVQAYRLLTGDDELAAAYRQQFRLVMVDEFQDTDALQVSIIDQLVPPDKHSLATVGDLQQSIYGFRGADPDVYLAQRDAMQELDAKLVKLDENYRSHDQILRFVDALFGQSQVFGSELVSLASKRRGPEQPKLPADQPRVRLLVSTGQSMPTDDGKSKDPDLAVLRPQLAAMIADEFIRLRDDYGFRSKEMALLLGKTTNADVYIDAFSDRGLNSMVVGGSGFYKACEVGILIQYLAALANPYDELALLSTLTSPLFNLTDDELLTVASVKGELYSSLLQSEQDSIAHAAAAFQAAQSRIDHLSAAEVLLASLHDSGWEQVLLGSGTIGQSALANIHKLIRLVAEYQSNSQASFNATAAWFTNILQAESSAPKEKPGLLQGADSDAVNIMTIHASKGLEFAVAAVAEYDLSNRGGGKSNAVLYSQRVGEKLYLAIEPKPSPKYGNEKSSTNYGKAIKANRDQIGEQLGSPERASSCLELYCYLRSLAIAKELPECQRKFYVACTRARDVLLVGACDKTLLAKPNNPRKAIAGDIQQAFFPAGLPTSSAEFAFGGAAGYRGAWDVRVLPAGAAGSGADGEGSAEDDFDNEQGSDDGLRLQTVPFRDIIAPMLPAGEDLCLRLERGQRLAPASYSYSSLARAHEPDSDIAHIALTAREEKRATIFGSAFHRACQLLLVATDELNRPLRDAQLTAEENQRLDAAFERWVSSPRAAELTAMPEVFAEYPFVVPLPGAQARIVPLEGKIDALGLDLANHRALIIDYKTGTSGEGQPDELRQRYQQQAACYAYAILTAFAGGVEQVELAFIRPEAQAPAGGGLEEVVYTYTINDRETLLELINSSYRGVLDTPVFRHVEECPAHLLIAIQIIV
ncbi:MAG: UvrD-helicase domain-containing protein [Coriobacteriales bacterium]|jgi:ATP-dependent exoDNAse (exonuclease V) beta subunit|nr:UvrD-helicase domain-containing protein [Coriobacteriales bacterium]